jgi:hypothetical protein
MTKRLDQGEITVSGTSDAYEDEVSRLVTNMILTTVTGRAIATKIKAHGEVLITDDYTGIDSRDINSEFKPGLSKRNLGIVGFHPHNKTINTVEILLNGKPISSRQLSYIQEHAPSMKPDEILCHELVHAARYLGGDYKKTPIPKMPDYDDEEEYFAVLVSNIYTAEMKRGVESLAKSHRIKYKPEMNSAEMLPFVFATEDDNLRLIAKFCEQHPTIAPMIARAPAAFNPIRDYFALTNAW